MDSVQQTRDFIFFFDTSLSPFYEQFSYNDLDGNIRYVPPHPDDHGAVTSPIEVVDNESGDPRSTDYYGFEWDLNFNFVLYERFFLKYTFGIGMVWNDKAAVGEGGYARPPEPRQPYDSGEDAYTFITINAQPIITNYLSLGYFASILDKPFPHEDGIFTFEGGPMVRTYTVMRGWDRYAAVEALDRSYANSWGGFMMVKYRKNFYYPDSEHAFACLGIGAKIMFTQSSFVIVLDLPMPFGFSS